MKQLITGIIFLVSMNTFGQFNPLDLVDKIAGTLLPEVVNGVKNIKDANKKSDKDEEAKKLEEKFKLEKDNAIKKAKQEIISDIGYEIEFLEAISLVQSQIERISNDVGRLSIFKDEVFLETLKQQQAVKVKNEVVRKFQNALEQVNKNMPELRAARNKVGTSSIPADAKAALYLGSIIAKLDEINASYNDCSVLNQSNLESKKTNSCILSIRSVSADIARLENLVEELNTESSAMLLSYIKRYKNIKLKANH
ncbi:MAG: hypothetical protein AAGD88_12080 [Bacteroidota bacterium]